MIDAAREELTAALARLLDEHGLGKPAVEGQVRRHTLRAIDTITRGSVSAVTLHDGSTDADVTLYVQVRRRKPE
jgi:hypothetical protein